MACLRGSGADRRVCGRLHDPFDVQRLEDREGAGLGPGRRDDSVAHAHLKHALARPRGVDGDGNGLVIGAALECVLDPAGDFLRPRLERASRLAGLDRDGRVGTAAPGGVGRHDRARAGKRRQRY